MEEIMKLINKKFLKDYELLYLEDNDLVESCKYLRPHNAHYKEYLVTINSNNKTQEHIVCCKFI